VGDTLYISGSIGIDPKTGNAPGRIEDEIKLLLDGYKSLLAQAGYSMDDLVYVQISCTDLSHYDKFNATYKTYFTKDLPAREFIGVSSLLRGATKTRSGALEGPLRHVGLHGPARLD
jgi:enamine deaminase RidA (YjgF/YER057c/UK114 family)